MSYFCTVCSGPLPGHHVNDMGFLMDDMHSECRIKLERGEVRIKSFDEIQLENEERKHQYKIQKQQEKLQKKQKKKKH